MDKKASYVSIDCGDYLLKKEYEKIEKRKGFNLHFFIGLANSAFVLGIPTAYAGYAHGSEQSLVEVAKNSSLENLVLWGGLFLLNLACARHSFSEAYRLKKDLKD